MIELNQVAADEIIDEWDFINWRDENIANMDKTDWLSLMMEMRIIDI